MLIYEFLSRTFKKSAWALIQCFSSDFYRSHVNSYCPQRIRHSSKGPIIPDRGTAPAFA